LNQQNKILGFGCIFILASCNSVTQQIHILLNSSNLDCIKKST